MSAKEKQHEFTHGQQLVALLLSWQAGVTFQTALRYVKGMDYSGWDKIADRLRSDLVEAQEAALDRTRH